MSLCVLVVTEEKPHISRNFAVMAIRTGEAELDLYGCENTRINTVQQTSPYIKSLPMLSLRPLVHFTPEQIATV